MRANRSWLRLSHDDGEGEDDLLCFLFHGVVFVVVWVLESNTKEIRVQSDTHKLMILLRTMIQAACMHDAALRGGRTELRIV